MTSPTRRQSFGAAMDLRDSPEALKARFWSKVKTAGAGECWPWQAYQMKSGYGVFTLRKGVFVTASRVALALTTPIPDGHVACHRCDNPPCCNPLHLFVGTQADNANDCQLKGRGGRRDRGEASPSAKLTEEAVLRIRAYPDRYGLTAALARESLRLLADDSEGPPVGDLGGGEGGMTAPTWMDDALCQSVDSDLFFPAASDYAAARTAKWLCRRCPVIDSCLQYAVVDASIDGIWGGTSPNQPQAIRRERRVA